MVEMHMADPPSSMIFFTNLSCIARTASETARPFVTGGCSASCTIWVEHPAPIKRGASIRELLILFLNPLVIILLVASFVSLLLGKTMDSVIPLVLVARRVHYHAKNYALLIGAGGGIRLAPLACWPARGSLFPPLSSKWWAKA